MEQGWIKLHRKTLSNPLAQKPVYLALWITLLLKANHEPKKMIWNHNIIVINEGQFITGRKQLSAQTSIPESTVEDILKFLESQHQIQQQKTTKYRLVTILNWKDYQNPTDNPTTKQQQADTNKNYNKEKNNIPSKARAQKTMKKNSFNYSESNSSDSYEDVIDADSGERVSIAKTDKTKVYWEMVDWAQTRRGFKFLNIKKQFKAFKMAKDAEIKPAELQQRWSEFETDKFWKEKGFDFMDVVNSFNKKR